MSLGAGAFGEWSLGVEGLGFGVSGFGVWLMGRPGFGGRF